METNDFIINLRIIPSSSKNELVQDGEILKLKLTAQPVENKANKAMVEFLSKHFKVAKTKIKIIKGHTSRDKRVLIKDFIE